MLPLAVAAYFRYEAVPCHTGGNGTTRMAYTTGRCINDLYCAAASSKQNLQIPVGAQFVCPQCGKALVEPPSERRGATRPVLIACGGLVLAGGALFAAGAMIGGGSTAPKALPVPAIAVVEADRPAPPHKVEAASVPPPAPTPRLAAGAPAAASSVASAAPSPALPALSAPKTEAAPAPAPARPAVVQLAMMQVPAKSPPPPQQQAQAPSSPPAAAPSQTQAAAQANAARQAIAVKQARAAELARRTQLALLAAQQQQRAAQVQAAMEAQELRRRTEQQKAQADADAAARQQEEASRAAQAAAAAAAARQRDELAAKKLASIPHGPTRGFSPSAVEGGAPSYPSAYEGDGRSGRVTVSCMIEQNGTPSGCHVLASQGGAGFSNAALGWLRSGEVRFAPVLRDGQPQAGEHSWTLNFQP